MPGNDYWSTPVQQQQPNATAQPKPAQPAKSNSKLPLIIGAVAGAAVLLPLMGIGVWFFASWLFFNSDSPGKGPIAQSGNAATEQSDSSESTDSQQQADDAQVTFETDMATNLRRIGTAMMNFESTFKRLPNVAGSRRDAEGKTLPTQLSWRVMILPFLEQQELFDQFKLDEPWDSPHNLELLPRMPAVFAWDKTSQPGFTSVHMISGEKMFAGHSPVSMASIQDGAVNTMMIVAAGKETATEWTKPTSINLDEASSLSVLGTPPLAFGFLTVDFTTRLREVAPSTSFEVFRAYATHRGGEVQEREMPEYRPRSIDGGASIFGFTPHLQKSLQEFIVQGKAKDQGVDKRQAVKEVALLRASLKQLAEEQEITPNSSGSYNLPQNSLLVKKLEQVGAGFKSVPFNTSGLNLPPVAQAIVKAAENGELTDELKDCLMLYVLVTITKR